MNSNSTKNYRVNSTTTARSNLNAILGGFPLVATSEVPACTLAKLKSYTLHGAASAVYAVKRVALTNLNVKLKAKREAEVNLQTARHMTENVIWESCDVPIRIFSG